MFCSTIIPTIGRPELSRAVKSVLNQEFPADDFEIIVVNDSGKSLNQANWQQSEHVQIINTKQRERSIARNTGAAIAKGRYLHFLDDDDWLLPNALKNLWDLANLSDAVWLYGGTQLVDRDGEPIIKLHQGISGNGFIQVLAGEHIHLQASLIDAEMFFAIGGFNPMINASEDIDLCRRVALRGNLAETPVVVVCKVMGVQGSSSDYVRLPQYSRWAREKILNEPGAFTRMQQSANSSYWHGRIVRAYLTSMVWNLQRRNVFNAMSRGMFGLMSITLAGSNVFSTRFWRAITKAHDSEAFARGFQEADTSV